MKESEVREKPPRSIKMMVPSGWNKFDGEVGAYDLKWQDLVDKTENIKISSTPVKSNSTSISLLGEVEDVGVSLAAKRNAKLLAATERQTDGILFYKFDFAINDGTHQLLQLCICKGKLWSIDANENDVDTCALRSFNTSLIEDDRVEVLMLPVRDGLTVVRKK